MTKKVRKVIRYSNCFKLEAVEEIGKNGLSIGDCRRKYGISGNNDVNIRNEICLLTNLYYDFFKRNSDYYIFTNPPISFSTSSFYCKFAAREQTGTSGSCSRNPQS